MSMVLCLAVQNCQFRLRKCYHCINVTSVYNVSINRTVDNCITGHKWLSFHFTLACIKLHFPEEVSGASHDSVWFLAKLWNSAMRTWVIRFILYKYYIYSTFILHSLSSDAIGSLIASRPISSRQLFGRGSD